MKRRLLFITFLLLNYAAMSQITSMVYNNPKDSTDNFYWLQIPKNKIKGLLALNYQALSDSTRNLASEQGIVLMDAIPSKNYFDIFLEDKPLENWSKMIAELCEKYQIPKDKIIVGGMSAGGTGAMRLAQAILAGNLQSNFKIAGILEADPLLDYERDWHSCKKDIERNFTQIAVNEAETLIKIYEEKLGGTPYQNLKSYQEKSPFCYSAMGGGNAQLLKNMPMLIYHEPDINWWIENRRKDYYSMNSIDVGAMVNQLRFDGNNEIKLISTQNKGYREDGTRHPHSWSIVDEKELLNWCNFIFDRK